MNSSIPLTVALVGMGNQGREQLNACLRNPHLVKIAAIVDPAFERLTTPEHLPPECRIFQSIDQLPQDLVQAAIVAIPPCEYGKLLPALLGRSIHLLVEKPLGMNLAEATGLLKTATQRRVVLMPGVQRRFHESYKKIQPILRREMGRVTQAAFRIELNKTSDGWRKEQGVGCLIDLGFHALDLARDLFGDLHLQSSAVFDHNGYPCCDRNDASAHLLFKTESGTHLRLVVKEGAEQKIETFYAKSLTHRLVADRAGWSLHSHDGQVQKGTCSREWESAMDKQLENFVQAAQEVGISLPRQPVEFGLVTMKLLEEIYARASVA